MAGIEAKPQILGSLGLLKSVPVIVRLHNFPIFSFLAKMLSFVTEATQYCVTAGSTPIEISAIKGVRPKNVVISAEK